MAVLPAGTRAPGSSRARIAGRSARRVSAAALAGYAILSVLLFGVRVLAHPGSSYVGGVTTDPQVFIWSLAWWPHAVFHGLNPLVTRELWVPVGVNLAWTQTAPALAIVLAPLTLAAGPVTTYNVAALSMPALAAWTAFLLCRRLTSATWPALVGGYLFGFSTYMVGGTLSHVQTTTVFLIPLVAIVFLQFFDREIEGRGLALRLGALLAAQGLLETELLFTMTLVLAVALVLVAILIPEGRARVRSLAAPLAGAYALAAVVMSPLLYYLAVTRSDENARGSPAFVGDVLNFVVPTQVEAIGWWAGHVTRRFPGNVAERGTYIGIPVLIIVVLFARMRWRTGGGRLLVTAFTLGAIATLGSWLTIDGHRLFSLPWTYLDSVPLFEAVMPVRFSLYTALVVAVMVALWLRETTAGSWLRIWLPALAVLALIPNVGLAGWAGPGARTLFAAEPPRIPRLFADVGYRHCLQKNEVVLAVPLGARGNSLIWQATSGFWFRFAGGYLLNAVPPFFRQPYTVEQIADNQEPSKVTLADVRDFTQAASVTSIVLNAAQSRPWRRLLDQLARPQAVGGVLIYRLDADDGSRTAENARKRRECAAEATRAAPR